MKLKVIIRLLIIYFIFSNQNNLYAKNKIFMNEINVKRLKTKEIHIKTSAYICALKQENISIKEIRNNINNMFNNKYSESDNSIMRIIVHKMCPEEDLNLLFQ